MKRTKQGNTYTISKDHALEIFSAGSFLPINKRLLYHFGPELAVYISSMVDQYKFHRKRKQLLPGDYFYFTTDFQIRVTGMTLYAVRKAKEFLIKNGIVSIKKIGMPAKECYRLHLQSLMEISVYCDDDFDTSRGDDFDTSRGDDFATTGEFIYNKFPITRPKDNKNKKTYKKDLDPFVPMAKYLSKIVKQTKNIEHSSVQINNWANEFRILHEQNKIDIQRMKTALKWYKIHAGGQYIPVIESGISFREKFTKLENAIQREGQTFGNKNTNSLGYKSLPINHQFRDDGSI